MIQISIPYMQELSKNRMWMQGKNRKTGKTTVYMSPEHKQIRELIIYKIKLANRQEWKKEKVWVSIHVQKPKTRIDAINMIDGICDAVKEAIGIDDCWFSIREVDWEIKKDNPQIFIKVEQESEVGDKVLVDRNRFETLKEMEKRLRQWLEEIKAK